MGGELTDAQLMIEIKKIEVDHDKWRRDFAAEMGYGSYKEMFGPFYKTPEILTDDNDAHALDTIEEILPACSNENYDNVALNPYVDPYETNRVSVLDAWIPEELEKLKEVNEEEDLDELEIDIYEEDVYPEEWMDNLTERFKNIHIV